MRGGGGGNFGIVTSFLFEAHPVSTVCAGPMLWSLEDAPAVMKWYREFIMRAPEDMNGFFAFLTVPPAPPFPEELHMKKMCGIVWCFPGAMEQANAILEPIRSFRPPASEFFVPMPFPMLQGMFDGLYPPGLQWYWKGDFFKELSDEAIARYMVHGAQLPTMNFMMDEGSGRIQAAYRENYPRLAELKKKYDPRNFFRVNQNIQPA